MAESKATKDTPKPAGDNKGYVTVSKTVITTYQNSSGGKKVVRETTTAPRKQKQQSAPKTTAKKPNTRKGVSKK